MKMLPDYYFVEIKIR